MISGARSDLKDKLLDKYVLSVLFFFVLIEFILMMPRLSIEMMLLIFLYFMGCYLFYFVLVLVFKNKNYAKNLFFLIAIIKFWVLMGAMYGAFSNCYDHTVDCPDEFSYFYFLLNAFYMIFIGSAAITILFFHLFTKFIIFISRNA